MKYKTVRDILFDNFAEDEIKLEGYDAFIDATDRIHDNRPYPQGMTKAEFYWATHSNPETLPYPPGEKKKKFKQLVYDFIKSHPKCDIYQDTNEVERCAIRGLY